MVVSNDRSRIVLGPPATPDGTGNEFDVLAGFTWCTRSKQRVKPTNRINYFTTNSHVRAVDNARADEAGRDVARHAHIFDANCCVGRVVEHDASADHVHVLRLEYLKKLPEEVRSWIAVIVGERDDGSLSVHEPEIARAGQPRATVSELSHRNSRARAECGNFRSGAVDRRVVDDNQLPATVRLFQRIEWCEELP